MTLPSTREQADVRPFSNASEADYWRGKNCDRCALNTWRGNGDELPSCPMEEAVAKGYIIGTVPADLAKEYGAEIRDGYADLPHECPKLELIQRCEYVRWPGTRRASKCGSTASAQVSSKGYRYAVCPRHAKVCAVSALASSDIETGTSESPTPPFSGEPSK